MSTVSEPSPPLPPSLRGRLRDWTRAQRGAAASHLLKGICYGTGTALAGVISFWVENRL